MIVFHEGLPGAGKSYEAAVYHMLPALLKGRQIITNIDGVNHAKFAEMTNIPLNVVRKLITVIDADLEGEKQRAELYNKTVPESLIVIDEIQDFFPATREPLEEHWTKYITQHRHEKLDIILMGQDYRDVHAIWRRRIKRLTTFTNLEAVGKPNSYKWEMHQWKRRDCYEKMNSGVRNYDPQYFGLYSSFKDGSEQFEQYEDERANLFSNKKWRYAPFLIVGALVWSGVTLYDFFTPSQAIAEEETAKPIRDTTPYQQNQPQPQPQRVAENQQPKPQPGAGTQIQPAEPKEEPPLDQFDSDRGKGRLRLSGLVYTQDRLVGYVDIVKSSGHIFDRYSIASLSDLGWKVENRDSGLLLSKEKKTVLVRAWPTETSQYAVNRTTQESL